ncbi:MAG: transporter substrate-binding domain-containing protein [Deltaproteobacteria bacterium]|nr:transporter substrate-binding domain-containing protein [Deltaproteobacteria bacterium]
MKPILALLVLGVGLVSSAGASALSLGPEERAFLRQHPVIRVGTDRNWPPFDFFDPLKGHQGIASGYLKEVGQRLGVTFEIHADEWSKVLGLAKFGEVDMLACAAKTPQREAFLDFSDPYVTIDIAAFVRKDNTAVATLSDLRGKTVALPQGNFLNDHLQNHYPDIRLRFTASNEEALDLVSLGEVDAHIGNIAVGGYFLEKNIITNVRVAFKIPALRSGFCFASVKTKPVLHRLLQKALADIGEETHRRIRREWVSFFAEDRQPAVTLSPREREWLLRHPVIRVGAGSEWPPYDFRQKGEYLGIARDYLDLVARKAGLHFDYTTADTWAGLQQRLLERRIDLLPAIYLDEAYRDRLLFTDVYIEAREFVFVREEGGTAAKLEELNGKTAVFVAGSNTLPVLRKRLPSVRIVEVDTVREALRLLTENQADFYIDTFGAVSHLSGQLGLVGIKAAFPVDLVDTGLRMAVSKDEPLLFAIVQKALKSVTPEEKEGVERRWFGPGLRDRHKGIYLTEAEQAWIREHPVVTVAGDPLRAPVSFFNKNGDYSGILADYLALIQERTGLKFSPRRAESFAAALAAVKERRLDMVDAVEFSPERFESMAFSNEHIHVDNVIVVPKDGLALRRIAELSGHRVGVVAGHLAGERLRRDVADVRLRPFTDLEAGLRELSQGKLEAFVIDLPTLDFLSQKLGLSNLKVSGGTPYSFALYFGLRKDLPMLRAILNKALASIDVPERQEIYRRWVGFEYEAEVDYTLLWQIAGFLFLIIAGALYWNRRLSREIGERKRVEGELLVAKEAAEKATRAKSEFLANMSHEIRTPMNSVIGFADILDGLIQDPLQKNYLRSIKIGGKALLGIIDDILDLSKIEAGQLNLAYESINPHLLFSEMEQLFHEKMAGKNLEFRIEVDPDLPEFLILDGIRLRQILLNLIGNAVKFTDRGEITLVARKVFKDARKSKIDLELQVSDTGVGIPAENQERIFRIFEQQEGQDVKKYGGTGLGLSICKKLVTLMNGEISVASEVGRGSVFTVTLHDVDVSAVGAAATDSAAEDDLAFEPSTILIVDDVADNRELVKACFRGEPVVVLEAAHGREAIDQLECGGAVDLILMDLRMPVMNGYEAAALIRARKEWREMPLVALTASVVGEDLGSIGKFGFNGYLRKPVEKRKLRREAARFLRHGQGGPALPGPEELPRLPSAAVRDAVVSRLENELVPEWRNVKDKGDMELIRGFADHLRGLDAEFELEMLKNYSAKLAACMESFDLAELYELMSRFPGIVEGIRNAEVNPDGQ